MADYSDILLTVDYDRTLTAPDSTIPPVNLDAIREFMAAGGIFTVNTGRSVPMAQSMLGKVPVNAPFLLYNGSAAYDYARNQLTQLHEIPLDLWETVDLCRELFPYLAVEVQGVDYHYQITDKPGWTEFCNYNHCPCAMAHRGMDMGPFLKFSLYGQFHDVTVASLFSGTPEELEQMDYAQAELHRLLGDRVECFRAAPRIIDVHAKGVSKARSARELQRRLGRKILVCIGDAENDISMLEDADYAFVPSDAILADRFPNVCPCGEGAVADVIRNVLPRL